ncbi:MAG TPA: CapA family protein [Rhizomicrobium sp.]|nr:CapA family protein [Rhizomicrobium sp.]
MRADRGHRFIGILAGAVFAAAFAIQYSGVAIFPIPERHAARICKVVAQTIAAPAPKLPGHFFWLSRDFAPGDPRLVDVVGAGDVMMGSRDQGLDPDIESEAAALAHSEIATIFHRADIAFVNLEGPLYDGKDAPSKICKRCYVFRSPTAYAQFLAQLGVRAVSLANNHSGDYGEAGRTSTLDALRANHIAYFGLDRDDARVAEIALRNGTQAALVSFAPNADTPDINDLEAAARLIRALKATHAIVVVSFHGGAEGEDFAHVVPGHAFFDGEDRGDVLAFAHNAIDAGADIVIGQGPHVPRALELYRGHLIAYSLGNFWTYGAIDTSAARGDGPVIEAWLVPDGTVAGFTIHSTTQHDGNAPAIDPTDDAGQRMLALTRDDFPESAARLEAAMPAGAAVAMHTPGL